MSGSASALSWAARLAASWAVRAGSSGDFASAARRMVSASGYCLRAIRIWARPELAAAESGSVERIWR